MDINDISIQVDLYTKTEWMRSWKIILFDALARANGCNLKAQRKSSIIELSGPEMNVFSVRTEGLELIEKIRKECNEYWWEKNKPPDSRKFRLNFYFKRMRQLGLELNENLIGEI